MIREKAISNDNQTVAYLADESFCELLQQLMEEQNVSVKKLSEGLCTESTLSRIKSGERVPDKMLRDRLLARLGISGERNENFLDYEEYVKWMKRRDIIKSVKRKEIPKAYKLLEKYARSKEFAGIVEGQFYHAMQIQLMLYEGASSEELAERLEEAVKLTVPNIDERKICDLQLSLQELNLVLEYEKYRHPERFTGRCEELLEYIENSPMDERNRAKIYPKVAWYLCESLSKGEEHYAQIVEVLNRAIEYLRNTQKNHYLWELLALRESILEKWMELLQEEGKAKQAEALQKMYQENSQWKNAIEAAYKMAQYTAEADSFCYFYMQQEIYCINEVMRCRREMLGISRRKLNAGTFDEKTLIRMETEHRKSRRFVVKTLFERLNLSGELQRVDVVTGSKEARDLLEKLVKYANNFDLENERKTLEELEKYLNMNIPLNRQFVMAERAILVYGGDKNNREQAFELMMEALECTIPFEKIQKSEKRYLTGGEISCLYNMASYCGNLALNEYHMILLEMCEEYEIEDIIEEHIALYAWIMTLIAKVYSNMKQHEQAIELSEKIMRASLECGRLVLVDENLYCISWNKAQLQKREASGGEKCARGKELEVCRDLSKFCKDTYREKKYISKMQNIEE